MLAGCGEDCEGFLAESTAAEEECHAEVVSLCIVVCMVASCAYGALLGAGAGSVCMQGIVCTYTRA